MQRQGSIGAFWLFLLGPAAGAQVIERPVPFDSAAIVMVVTPRIAERAALGPPSWPVSGDFAEARLYTVTDSTYILTVRRETGVVERYNLAAADRNAIRVNVSRLPPDVVRERNDAGNAFIRNQTLLGLALYAPAFSYAIGEDNATSATAGYLVVAGGTFFAASEVARRMFISRAQNDLSANTGLNGGLGTGALVYILGGGDRAIAAGAFVGGLAGTGIGLAWGRGMTEAEAVGAGFGADLGAAIGWGTVSTLNGESRCTVSLEGTTCRDRISDKAKAFTVLASGLVGYPLGVLYPRNSNYNVTPGDIQMLGSALVVGALAGASLLPDSPRESTAWAALTLGGIAGVLAGDRFLVRRADHSRTDASRVGLGTGAGALMGLGVAALIDNDLDNPQMAFALMTLGGLTGLIVTERAVDPRSDAGRQRIRVTLNTSGLAMVATGTKGMHSLLTVRF